MCAICTIMRAWQDIVQGTPSTEKGRHGLCVQSVPEKGPLEILLACICHEPLAGALQLGRLRLPCYSSPRLEAAQLLLPHWEVGLGTSVEAGWTQPRIGLVECHPTHHGPPKPKECCPGPGVHWGEGSWPPGPQRAVPLHLPYTLTLPPPSPGALGSCQKYTHFILFFIFLIKGLHIIVCLTKTKVLVSEFENYFPRINGKGSLINIF